MHLTMQCRTSRGAHQHFQTKKCPWLRRSSLCTWSRRWLETTLENPRKPRRDILHKRRLNSSGAKTSEAILDEYCHGLTNSVSKSFASASMCTNPNEVMEFMSSTRACRGFSNVCEKFVTIRRARARDRDSRSPTL